MMESGSRTLQNKFEINSCCVIVPTYNNGQTLAGVLDSILTYTNHIIIIDDGSSDSTAEILMGYSGLKLLLFKKNRGKGYALKKAFGWARVMGYQYAISMDSDGQHFASDLPAFLAAIEENPDTLIVGARNMDDAGAPGKSNFGFRFSNFWYTVTTGIKLPDTQSGFRLYPLEKLKSIAFITRRFEFEVEVIVRAAWRRINVMSIPIKVYYPPKGERVSHFRPFTDFFRI
ncbi:MAG: glycosyltransferase family 2 protein, partial [Bacteroidales bacterium]|nr:glycosyltransferase family 2 protein [Bacteroidales bacterium]